MFPEAILRLRIKKARSGGACWDVACTGRNSECGGFIASRTFRKKKERRRRTEGKGEVRLANSSHLFGAQEHPARSILFFCGQR